MQLNQILIQARRYVAQSMCDPRTNNLQHIARLTLRIADSGPVWQAINDG
jgi:hypothetical protein